MALQQLSELMAGRDATTASQAACWLDRSPAQQALGSPRPGRLGMSEREYARHAGVSRGCVQKARSSGRLVLHPDGSIDAATSDALRLQATDPSKQRGRHA